MPLRCIVFDCDGVLLDSVGVKTLAFARLAEPYGSEAASRFVAFHEAHGGVSRYEKFAWFFKTILKRPIREEESKAWGEKFAALCAEALRQCPLIPGAREVLMRWHGVLPLFVCSGAPGKEQEAILQNHGLAQYFDAIYGAPPAKTELLAALLAERNIHPSCALMVGDATTDRDAAFATGTHFYGVGSAIADERYPWGLDLTNLSAHIESLLKPNV
ncbi:MAG: HAD family hydrolase [Desulfovibrionaceae bacterium]|nr:HAD family hydrolase [Desulfovibrionaceae bacterium]